jgi:carboxyl-terminal processing protease
MRNRILKTAATLALGIAVPAAGLRLAALFGLLPSREQARASAYIRDVLGLVNEDYVDAAAVGYDNLARAAIHGMVESLDPHSEFLESKDNAELEEDLSGEFGGVGIQVEVRAGKIVVIAPMPGTPADRAGIRRGDEITSIDGQLVAGSSGMDVVVDRLRGKPHTRVALGVSRPAERRSFAVTLEREVIKVDSVTHAAVLQGDVGYVLVTEFSEHTGEQFANAVDGLLKKNINSLVIDLRNNPGGLLDAAVEVAEPFFGKGELIVSTRGRKPSDQEEFRSEADGRPLDLPVAILINQDTASAAEIVTGALKDRAKAVVVGERSFGKGSVQSIIKLKNGEGLRLTTAKYYTPSGLSLHQKGVTPNVEVILTAEDDDKVREQAQRDDLADPKEFKERFGFTPIADRQLETAVELMKGVEAIDGQAQDQQRLAKPPAKVAGPSGRGAIEICGVPPHDRG